MYDLRRALEDVQTCRRHHPSSVAFDCRLGCVTIFLELPHPDAVAGMRIVRRENVIRFSTGNNQDAVRVLLEHRVECDLQPTVVVQNRNDVTLVCLDPAERCRLVR